MVLTHDDILIVDGNDNPVEFTQDGVIEGLMARTSVVRCVKDNVDLFSAVLVVNVNLSFVNSASFGNIHNGLATVAGIEFIADRFVDEVTYYLEQEQIDNAG